MNLWDAVGNELEDAILVMEIEKVVAAANVKINATHADAKK